MVKPFTHLSVASNYSFKYGVNHPEQLVERAAQLNMDSLALTDIDNLAAAVRFAQSCEAHNIAPILGINIGFIQKQSRITLLAKSGKLSSLYRLITAINTNTTDGVLTVELLEKFNNYSSDLIALFGAKSSMITNLVARKEGAALSIYQLAKSQFDQVVIECVSHLERVGNLGSTSYAAKSLTFANKHQIPAVITNSVRFIDRSDGPVADLLDASRKLSLISDASIERSNGEAYLKDTQMMYYLADQISRQAGLADGHQLVKTTLDIAQICQLKPRGEIGLGGVHLPEPSLFNAKNQAQLLDQLHQKAAAVIGDYYPSDLTTTAATRLSQEINTIGQLGFTSYFLTVAGIVDAARSLGIRVAARGSAAGSLTCHLLGISEVDPISNGLLMERFCSLERNELPDIDIDVESDRRYEIYDLIFKRYGDSDWAKVGNQGRCATVSMVERYRARHAIRDAGNALGADRTQIDLLAKSMPHISARNIGNAINQLPELKRLDLSSPLIKATINLAMRLDKLPRHLSMHPCAVVISDNKLLDFAPISINQSNYPMLSFDKDDVEALGFLKLDVLGVRMQSAIAYTIKEIKECDDEDLDIKKIPLDDELTFDLIKSTRTLGLFQVESPGQRELVGKLVPDQFNDLVIGISLFRPGPIKSEMITPFLNARSGVINPNLIHEDLAPILEQTKGVVVFHEQVIQIIAKMTGSTFGAADQMRRNLGSKDGAQEVCDWFYQRAAKRGYAKSVVDYTWQILRDFASFGFCKAHASAFAMTTYQSAYLKTHHTAAFLAAVLTHEPGMYPKRLIIDEARQWGIQILPVDINKSDASYRVEKVEVSDKNNYLYTAPNTKSSGAKLTLPDASSYGIRVSLADIAGISAAEIKSIIENRPYTDLADFTYRSGAHWPTTQILVEIGAFDLLHGITKISKLNRRDLYVHLQELKQLNAGKAASGQLSLALSPGDIDSLGLPDITKGEQISNELQNLGLDITEHLLKQYAPFLDALKVCKSSDLIRVRSNQEVLVVGVKVALQSPPIRSGKRVLFLTLDDGFGCSDLTFFEDAQQSYAHVIKGNNLILAKGVVRRTGARGVSIRANSAWSLDELYEKWLKEQSMVVSITS
ncbi:MAG: DNA polymerase III subunit alpha [Candidatus Nanopelagicus sp.]